MISLKKNIPLVIHGFILLAFLGGIIYAHMKVRTLLKDVAERQAILQDTPAETIRAVTMKKDLDRALIDMKSIYETIPTEDGLVDAIAAISGAAVASEISAQLPVVGAKILSPDEASDDLFSDVRIHVLASGDPAALASFLYRVEHLPFILRVVFFKIDTIQQSSIASYAGSVPSEASNFNRVLESSLEAEIAIVTKTTDTLTTSPNL